MTSPAKESELLPILFSSLTIRCLQGIVKEEKEGRATPRAALCNLSAPHLADSFILKRKWNGVDSEAHSLGAPIWISSSTVFLKRAVHRNSTKRLYSTM